jgi:hypothetical protein
MYSVFPKEINKFRNVYFGIIIEKDKETYLVSQRNSMCTFFVTQQT